MVVRKYHPSFSSSELLVSAALEGGTQIMVFISTFAVQVDQDGRSFPNLAGNHADNFDYWHVQPANG